MVIIDELRKPRPWPQRVIVIGVTSLVLSLVGPLLASLAGPAVADRAAGSAGPFFVVGLAAVAVGLHAVKARRRSAG